jgi:outer membrane protein OmpA-like peptidoglycan-associated protein
MRIRVLACALLLAATPAAAQSPGTIELGGFGKYNFFDDTTGVQDKFGYGGSLGFYFWRNLGIEGDISRAETRDELGNEVSVTPIRVRLQFNLPAGENATALQFGAGYVRHRYGETYDVSENGITGLVGLRLGLHPNVAFRIAGTVDYISTPELQVSQDPEVDPAGNNSHFGIQAGLNFLLFNRYDSDRDGVRDGNDSCPNTPRGEPVDATGCSASQRDSDNDGVRDNADKCPDTPAGETVDPDGCSAGQKDADGDGVTDSADKCLNTPRGEEVDASGCSASQRDADRDGVSDARDKCPDTPAGEQVDGDGCSQGQRDADRDGVMDASDQCPDTPQGEPVDSRGCSRDSDADGVPDGRDECPATPNGAPVDERGCRILFQGGEKRVVLQGVNFEFNKATLTDSARVILSEVAKSLAANPGVRVEVGGHTDSKGGNAYNLALSRERAKAVEDFLEANGVSPAQITSRGYGESRPVASNRTEEGRAQNRRVELNRLN